MPHSLLFTQPPRWFAIGHRLGHPIPNALSDWLLETDSLTRRLRKLCREDFRVRVLQQDWDAPFIDEAVSLRLSAGRHAVVREVALQWRERPLVVARSVIPTGTLRGVDRRLAHLGNRPLGEILFADPRLRRHGLELAMPNHEVWQPAWREQLGPAGPTFGRRSRFTLGRGHRLLVAEFFLPALFELEAKR